MLVFLFILAFAQASIVSVVISFRHGGRAPVYKFSWDTGVWPQGLGQLTPSGMRQHYLNGREFRYKYITQNAVINPVYLEEQVYVRSTDYNRTIQSVESMLSGLFPIGPQIASQNLAAKAVPPLIVSNLDNIQAQLGLNALPNKFQTVPIHVVASPYDYMLAGYSSTTCARIGQIANEIAQQNEYQDALNEYKSGLQKQIQELWGTSPSFSEAGWMGDTITAELFEDFPMPNGVSTQMYYELAGAYNYTATYYYNKEVSSLAGSEFFEAVLYQFNSTINNTDTVRLGLYSAHDTTIAAFLSFMGMFSGKNPVFASTLIFELHEVTGAYFVQIIYNDQVMTLNGCQEMCPFDTFYTLIAENIVDDVEEACQLKSTTIFQ
ncbi:unnamed protein product [Blepharisma stoltei]|uniref:Acid phosphatase n=1 Tax=Blepharisma stoltei TaxID=1481888 RepID=A0AAU9KC18_9CILI|nr:unnamed protein product [Blepharisma stoltei]